MGITSLWRRYVQVQVTITEVPITEHGNIREVETLLLLLLTRALILRTNSSEDLHRSEAIRQGWGRHCFQLEFVDRSTSGITADWDEGYQNIAKKSLRAWQLMYDRYATEASEHQIDFVLKADTDTYILGDNMMTYLSRFDANTPHYLGKQLIHAEGYPLVAGTAIILSRASLKLFGEASHERKCTAAGWHPDAEDVALALCLRDLGVYPHNTRDQTGAERFMVLNPEAMLSSAASLPGWYVQMSLNKVKGHGCCSAEAVAFHYTALEQLTDKTLVCEEGEWLWQNLEV